MHLERRDFPLASLASADATTSSSVLLVGACIGILCAVALAAALLTTAVRRYRANCPHNGLEDGHTRKESKNSDYGSPINLRATAAFQNIWQSVDLGRNSLPQSMIVKPGETGTSGLANVLAGMHQPSGSTDSSGSSTAIASRSRSNSGGAARRNSMLQNGRDVLLDGYTAAQGGFDPDAQPLHASTFSLHNEPLHEMPAEDEECDLGEMAVVVVAGGEEVSQVLEGMQLAEFYVHQGGPEPEEDVRVVDGSGYDSAPSPLYNEFSAGDAW